MRVEKREAVAEGDVGVTAVISEWQDSDQLQRIITRELPKVLELFARKNAEYGETASQDGDLGLAGQYSDLHRKMKKLKVAFWDGHPEQLTSESPEEVIKDMIGHLLLTLDMLRMSKSQSQYEGMVADDVAGRKEGSGDAGKDLQYGHPFDPIPNNMFSNGLHAIRMAGRGEERCHSYPRHVHGVDERLRCVGKAGHTTQASESAGERHINNAMDSWL